jgi:hypothetical protein
MAGERPSAADAIRGADKASWPFLGHSVRSVASSMTVTHRHMPPLAFDELASVLMAPGSRIAAVKVPIT